MMASLARGAPLLQYQLAFEAAASAEDVWSIRTKLEVEGRIRDLALFNIAIDSKLRGCDVLGLKVDDVASSGYAADRASVRQKKIGQPVKFEVTEFYPPNDL